MAGKNQYIVKNGDGWGVRGEGNDRLTKSFDTQREAIDYGRDITRNQGSELRIQGQDAKFREAWSYGNDPCTPCRRRRASGADLLTRRSCRQ